MVQNLWWAADYNVVAISACRWDLGARGHSAVAGDRCSADVVEHGHCRGECPIASAIGDMSGGANPPLDGSGLSPPPPKGDVTKLSRTKLSRWKDGTL
jgi:hypothetical protein